MKPDHRAATQTNRKLQLAIDTLSKLATTKQSNRAWGQVMVKLHWEDGHLKTVEIVDTTTIRDVGESDPHTLPAIRRAEEA